MESIGFLKGHRNSGTQGLPGVPGFRKTEASGLTQNNEYDTMHARFQA